jgi:hypothetical protein
VRHEDPAPEICLGQHVGKRGRVIDVEAWGMLVKVISAAGTARSRPNLHASHGVFTKLKQVRRHRLA